MRKKSFYNSRCYGGIIRSANNKYLLVQGYTGKWSFPKGHIEENESPYDCARREIYEETGYFIEEFLIKRAVFISAYYYFNVNVENEFEPNPIDTQEVIDAKWFTPEETISISKNKDVKVFFNQLLSKKKQITKSNIIQELNINPELNPNINPELNPNINPELNPNINPELKL